MTDQKPKRIFFGSSPLNTVAILIYFSVGYGLIKNSGLPRMLLRWDMIRDPDSVDFPSQGVRYDISDHQ